MTYQDAVKDAETRNLSCWRRGQADGTLTCGERGLPMVFVPCRKCGRPALRLKRRPVCVDCEDSGLARAVWRRLWVRGDLLNMLTTRAAFLVAEEMGMKPRIVRLG